MNFDVCIHCQVHGCLTDTAEHAPDCPTITGAYPVDQHMLDDICADCGAPFAAGEHYSEAPLTRDDRAITDALGLTGTGNVTIAVCIGCAVLRTGLR